MMLVNSLLSLNSQTLRSDQDRISPYNNNTISSRQVRIKKNMIEGISSDAIPNSQNKHDKNCLAVSKEISIINEILGVKWLTFKIDIFE